MRVHSSMRFHSRRFIGIARDGFDELSRPKAAGYGTFVARAADRKQREKSAPAFMQARGICAQEANRVKAESARYRQ